MKDLADIAHEPEQKCVDLIVPDQPVDTTIRAGRAFFGPLTVPEVPPRSVRLE